MTVGTGEKLRLRTQSKRTWSPPVSFNLSDPEDAHRLESSLTAGEVRTVVDPIEHLAKGLFELRHPDRRDDAHMRSAFVASTLDQGPAFGRWWLFEWSGQLVRFPDRDDLHALRTFRNRDLITAEEQRRLYSSTIAVFGLSVGSSVVERLVASGIGGTFVLADMDIIEPSNLNRINATFGDVGEHKVDFVAKRISTIDPYITQVHLRSGINSQLLESVILEHSPDLLIDEIDDLAMEAHVRQAGRRHRIPVLMASDVGDRSVIDVERHDLGARPFHGTLGKHLNELLEGHLTDAQKRQLLMKMVGVRNVSPRLIDSALRIDTDLAGLPQLGGTAEIGGALLAIAAREILLGRRLKSGQYVCSPKRILRLQPATTPRETLSIFRAFVASRSGG